MSNKRHFKDNDIEISPYAFHGGRNELVDKVHVLVFEAFHKSLIKFVNFIDKSHNMTIDRDSIVPVLLNVRDYNRSITSLKTNKNKARELRNDIVTSLSILTNLENKLQGENFTYLSLLILITAFKFDGLINENYEKFKAKLSSSQEYEDLRCLVYNLDTLDKKDEFEDEQINIFANIVNEIEELNRIL